jgi:hypothetical protein
MGVANETYHAPLAADSPVDNGGAIVIVNLVALIVSLWSVALRIYISNRKRGGSYKPYRDDWLCYASTVGTRRPVFSSTIDPLFSSYAL